MCVSLSGKSGDGVVDHGHFVGGVLVVDAFPLVVVIVFVVDGAVDHRLPHVHHEEQGQNGEGQAGPVARQAQVQVTIALVGGEGRPPAGVGRSRREGTLLLPQTWNVLVDLHLELGRNVVTLDHVHYLLLLLVDVREGRTDLGQVLVDVVLHIL